MKDTYTIGDSYTFDLETDETMSAGRFQESSPAVFATPFLVGAVEAAAARLMESWLEPGEMSVGGHVELSHSKPTPLGWTVRTEATLVEAKGRKFVFQVECFDAVEKIGSARHTRFVVDGGPFMELVAAKAADGEG